jgi:hypothetical protein
MDSDKAKHLIQIAYILDNSIPIPGTNYRFGIDPLLGLLGIVGGTGDFIGGALAAYIVIGAAQMGLPPSIIWQMVGNILFDSVVGLVPGVGDALDFTWKANSRNIALLKQYLNTAPEDRKNNPLFVIFVTVILGIIVFGFAILLVMLIRAIFKL